MKTKIRLLSILLTLAMFLGLMPGMSMTAYAYDGNPYASLVNSETTVTFNGRKWFIIADDSTAVDAGTVTLLAADNSFGLCSFSDDNSADYSNSKIKAYLDSLTAEGGSFAGVKDAIEDTDLPDVNVTGAKLYLLSIDEADHEFITNIVFIGPGLGDWWLRSHGQTPGTVAYVFPLNDGHIVQSGGDVREEYGVKPALRLNLSTVYFLSDSNTFLLRSSRYDVTYKVVGGTWPDGTTADKTETVQIGSKPASIPTGMKASEGYTGGAWDVDPSTAIITKTTTFTYTFTAKQAATITRAPTAETLTYSGSAQKLVTAGTADGGEMQYALGNDATTAPTTGYTTSIPTATNAGTYYVWYMVKGADNYSDVAGKCIKVTIASHKLTKVAAKEPDGKNNGNTAYWYCSDCKKYFSDKNGKKEIKKNSWVILAKDKTFKDSKSKGKYKVTSKGSKNPTVIYVGCTDSKATSVTVPATVKYGAMTYKVTEIGKGALKGKTKIKTITVGSNVKKINAEAFYGCKAATKISLGKNVTTIGAEAISGCTSLKELTLPAKTTTLGNKFLNKCNKKMKLTVKSTKMTKDTVKAGAFTGMTNKSGVAVIVPKGMKKTYKKIFQNNGLGSKITIKEKK